jgi:hypothetical protein
MGLYGLLQGEIYLFYEKDGIICDVGNSDFSFPKSEDLDLSYWPVSTSLTGFFRVSVTALREYNSYDGCRSTQRLLLEYTSGRSISGRLLLPGNYRSPDLFPDIL